MAPRIERKSRWVIPIFIIEPDRADRLGRSRTSLFYTVSSPMNRPFPALPDISSFLPYFRHNRLVSCHPWTQRPGPDSMNRQRAEREGSGTYMTRAVTGAVTVAPGH